MASRRLFKLIFIITGLLSLVLIYKYFNPIDHAIFPQCPIKHFTGLDCPGCGSQRAIHYLLNGQLRTSFYQNPLLFFLAPYLLLGFYLELIPRPTQRELKLRKIIYSYRAIQILFAVIILFTILRNIV